MKENRPKNQSSGSLTILEAETGAGKTDAAFAHFKNLKERGLCDSCYFALPTRTSAAQIYNRTNAAVARFLSPVPPVVLAVPGYMTDKPQPSAITVDTGVEADNVGSWHVLNSNRYLSAVVAVGTIDQALYAITGGKHSTMRWASFGRSLLVVDEVHASDSYMSGLLEAIIRRHVSRGGHVLLMSATLGSASTARFVRAAGARSYLPLDLNVASNVAYPVAHVVQNGKASVVPLAHSGTNKHVKLEVVRLIDDVASIAEIAAFHVNRGAKVLIIRNTVRGCVDLQQALEMSLSPEQIMHIGGLPVPHHGRFVAEDRLQLDEAIEQYFGKGSPSRGIVAIGTQTIEQSLDIDADIVITDACPVDVLLQRLGRLHRHHRARPPGYENPVAVLLTPTSGFSQYMKKPGNGFGRDRAYANILSVMATMELVTKFGTFSIPQDNRKLVELATHPEALQVILGQQPAFERYHNAVEGKQIGERTHAAQKARSETWRYGDSLGSNWESGPTRLGEPSIRVEFDRPVKTFLGNVVNGISIPNWMIEGYIFPIDERKYEVINLNSDIAFRIGMRNFSYTRFGLEIVREKNQSSQ